MNEIKNETPKHPPELIEKIISVQEKDIALKSQELELRKQTDNNSYNIFS